MRDHVNFIIASILPENVETMLNIRKAIRLQTRTQNIYVFKLSYPINRFTKEIN